MAATSQNHHHHSKKSYNQYRCWDRRRRDGEHRSPPLGCGCRDPWLCRCRDTQRSSEVQADAYRDAVKHLAICGLGAAPQVDEMRVLWRRGGDDRKLVSDLTEAWVIA